MARRKNPPVEELDLSALTPEDIQAAEKKAKEEFDREHKAELVSALVEDHKEKLRRARNPKEKLLFIRIILPEFCEHVMIDGVKYVHGWHGELPFNRYLSVQDAIARAWEHKLDTEGKKYPLRRKPRDIRLSGYEGDESLPAQAILERRVF